MQSTWEDLPAEARAEFNDEKTTVMLRNLPNGFTRSMLLELLESETFLDGCDLVYLPIDFGSGNSLGYAFVNLINPVIAAHFFGHFAGFCKWHSASDNVCAVAWSEPHQGLSQH